VSQRKSSNTLQKRMNVHIFFCGRDEFFPICGRSVYSQIPEYVIKSYGQKIINLQEDRFSLIFFFAFSVSASKIPYIRGSFTLFCFIFSKPEKYPDKKFPLNQVSVLDRFTVNTFIRKTAVYFLRPFFYLRCMEWCTANQNVLSL
jgi:hypothetical protein